MIWKNAIDEVATFLDKGKIPCILLENKFDLLENEKKDDPELIDFASKNKFDGVFRISAKTGLNIDESIKFLILNIIKRIEKLPDEMKEKLASSSKEKEEMEDKNNDSNDEDEKSKDESCNSKSKEESEEENEKDKKNNENE